jgi:DNA-binding transcriptional LysR family regulator
VSRELARVRVWLVASAEYLERRGTPKTIADLARHDLLAWESPGEDGRIWPLLNGGTFTVSPMLVARHIHLIRQFAIAGLGIALVPDAMLPDPGVAPGALVSVLPEQVGKEIALRVIVPAVLSEIPRIKALIELLKPVLGEFGL